MKKEIREMLVRTALAARERAYAPYSGFLVGAAIAASTEEIFEGCNIENISYSATVCAERTALFSAVAKGHTEFLGLAVCGGTKGEAPSDYCMPCAVCLQVIREFCPPEFPIYVVKSIDEVKEYKLKELLPVVFDSLGKDAEHERTK